MITNPGQELRDNDLVDATNRLSHRGPDSVGFYQQGSVNLGFRRLSIIDVEGGRQPLFNDKKTICLVLNGEIYNFRELRSELEAKGYLFHSRTDSEVVLNALIEWGRKALYRFNGMFALALWDIKERLLLLARDRYGIKPLYVSQKNNTFAFGSEQKAILAMPSFKRKIDKSALVEYFTFQNIA